ncbi:MAG TPA: beta-L-arabinofuranosidase domain-containing protein, partial [Gemmatimonadales bacterium]|nr:beta-L-arabinofuranosidase domain-containing protein [Gemmatimonadales bacterium]
MKRREFVALSTAAAALPLSRRWTLVPPPPAAAVTPFDLSRIRLLPGPLYDEMQVNRRFLLAQDPDRLLHTFRLNAGLPSSAEPLGGWEAPVNELRGHYT